ncbi:hypothetical protein AJ78_00230 [Emergomyces pasteurianus Ep9510]|uniref:Uncharacterized protein n=1 Tax=Emergomyces pasteurianus Ep9510 TaxID=1447872 RepID=A0A1J9PUD0_9EURO|nr:hypothetical protein AJ78_00230 [Emergomyces pasteurianus Ep9510]
MKVALINPVRMRMNSDNSDDDAFDDDEGQLPSEHYLAQAKSLDVSQLRQKRWRCDIHRGKNGRCCPGLQHKSSLEAFWMLWHLVLKRGTNSGLSKATIVKVDDVIALVTKQKDLELIRKLKKNMYIEDVPSSGRAPSTIHILKAGLYEEISEEEDSNEFKIPEPIFVSTLILSSHVCLLGMLFHIDGFKKISTTGPVLDSSKKPAQSHSAGGQEAAGVAIKDELLNKFVFCQVERTPTEFKINLEK